MEHLWSELVVTASQASFCIQHKRAVRALVADMNNIALLPSPAIILDASCRNERVLSSSHPQTRRK